MTESINWSSTWAGLVLAIGSAVLLGALGMGLNLGTVIGPAANTVWAGASLVISLFIGGLALSFHQPPQSLSLAARRGFILWGLTSTAALALATNNGLTGLVKTFFIPVSQSATGGVTALFSILMLAGAVLGAMAGALRPARA